MDPKLSNPNDPAMPTANVVVPPVVPEPVTSELPPLPSTQSSPPTSQPPIQNTPPSAPVANPISQNQPPAPPADTNFDGLPKKHLISKKIAATVLVLFLAVTIPLTVFVANQQQNTKTEAVNPITDATVVGVFDGKQITVADIKPIAFEQYSQDSVTNDVLLIARDIYVERKILDTKAAELNISVAQADIDSLAADTGLTPTQAKYELLKQQIIISQVNYVKAVSIGYWVPPAGEVTNYSSTDQQTAQKQIQEGGPAIDQAYNGLFAGQDPLIVAQSIYTNPSYVDLKPVLALNGNKFTQIDDADKQIAAEPVLYEYGDTNFDSKTRGVLFSTAKGAVVRNQSDTSSGGASVFKIIDKGSGTFGSYKAWLEQQKNLLSKQPNPDIL